MWLQDMASWMKSQSFDGFVQSELIPCGTYKAQPVFAVRHYRGTHVQLGPRYVYAVHTCRYFLHATFLFTIERQTHFLPVCSCLLLQIFMSEL